MMCAGRLVAIVTKIVDDLLASGASSTSDHIILAVSARVELGTILHRPGNLHYFCLNINQHENNATTVEGHEKLDGIESMPDSPLR